MVEGDKLLCSIQHMEPKIMQYLTGARLQAVDSTATIDRDTPLKASLSGSHSLAEGSMNGQDTVVSERHAQPLDRYV